MCAKPWAASALDIVQSKARTRDGQTNECKGRKRQFCVTLLVAATTGEKIHFQIPVLVYACFVYVFPVQEE